MNGAVTGIAAIVVVAVLITIGTIARMIGKDVGGTE